MLDLSPVELETIQDILRQHVPECEVRAFGSRARWTAKDYSDLDLAVVGAGRLEQTRLNRLREAFEGSALRFRVDVLDWHTISPDFQRVIEQGYEVIQKASGGWGMGGKWPRYEISQLMKDGKLIIGDGYRAKNEELALSGLPFARAGNINDGFRFDNADYFPVENVARVGNKVSQPGDVVFTSKGTVGRFAFVRSTTPRFVYSPQLCFWRSIDHGKIDPQFLYYWMFGREFFVQFKGVAGQTDMAEYVSLTDQRRMHITLPPLPEQRALAHVLGTLDDKIELNRKMNETFEAMARALFKSWFVDFDPVRAKAEGRQPAGMDAETAALFPFAFENTTLGEVPRGWRMGQLSEIASVIMGSSPPGDTYNEAGNGVSLVNGPVEFGDYFTLKRKWTTAPTRLSNKGDLVFCVRGSTTGRRVLSDDVYCLGRGVCAIRARDICQAFINQIINYDLERLLAKTSGSVFPNLSGADIGQFEISIPPTEIIERYCQLAEPLMQRAWQNAKESETLAALRDALLPKLMSGEVRVREG